MRVSEALELSDEHYLHPVEISGYLIISSHFVCLLEDEAASRSKNGQRGILVNRAALYPLEEQAVPGLAGGSISIAGNISLKASITHTGIAITPAYLPYIYEFRFSMPRHPEIPVFSYKHGDTFVDVYLQTPANLTASTLRLLKPLFPSSLNVMELKQLLTTVAEHQVGKHVRGEELQALISILDAAGCAWRTSECPIHWGAP
ncbi:hypothetical protein [Undibacterium pigrum]|uniref:Uncharacterized protein n=1 Tax=Undibacterium pigrum TaxID=401470 RepID=A0A318J2E9_9BURK|nr:hypothetical protein [Undibacterium pigrum]PXX41574.1 hypothetical protein DFR42_107225 [Undibacterium pigrum]